MTLNKKMFKTIINESIFGNEKIGERNCVISYDHGANGT
mgnify:CR=1 FL=1